MSEIAKQHVEAVNQVESQTLSNLSTVPDVSKLTAQFDNKDKCLIVGLARLQEMEPSIRGFNGNRINSSALGLRNTDRGNCTHRMRVLAKLVPSLLTTYLNNGHRFFLLTDKGIEYAKLIMSEQEN